MNYYHRSILCRKFALGWKGLYCVPLLFTMGCEKPEQKEKIPVPVVSREGLDIERQLEGRIFISREGKAQGSDSDMSISFLSDHKVAVKIMGYSVSVYRGKYAVVNGTNEVTVEIPTYWDQANEEKWPRMKVEVRNGRTLIFRSDGRTGRYHKSPDIVQFQNFWPFAEETVDPQKPSEK